MDVARLLQSEACAAVRDHPVGCGAATKDGEQARAVLEAPPDKYADEGIEHTETMNVLRVQPISRFGTPVEIVRLFGGRFEYEQAVRDLEAALYSVAG